MRLALFAPNLALRIGLRELLSSDPEIEVVAELASLDELAGLDEPVDLLVIAYLPGMEIRTLVEDADAALLILSDEPDLVQRLAGLAEGVWGVLSLNPSEGELLAAVKALGEGLWVGAPALVQDLLPKAPSQALSDEQTPVEALTGREIEILQLIAHGLANKQIALELGISEHTVKFHLSSVYTKLGVSSRTEAIRVGVHEGLIAL